MPGLSRAVHPTLSSDNDENYENEKQRYRNSIQYHQGSKQRGAIFELDTVFSSGQNNASLPLVYTQGPLFGAIHPNLPSRREPFIQNQKRGRVRCRPLNNSDSLD